MAEAEEVWVEIQDLVKGQKFLTPGDNVLTVIESRPADRAEYGYREVVTEEPYAAGDLFTAQSTYKVRVVS